MTLVTLDSAPNLAMIYLATLSPVSRKSIASQLRGVAQRIRPGSDLASFPWQVIDRMAVLALIDIMRREGKAPATINHALTTLRRVIEEGYYAELISRDQYEGVCRVARVKGKRLKDKEPPSREAVRAAINHALSDTSLRALRDATLLATLAGAGLRKAEAAGCITTDYRQGRYIRILGKGNKEALQPLSPSASELLDEYANQVPTGPLFPSWSRNDTPTGRHLSPAGFDKIIHRHLPGVTPHQLRHAYASWLSEDGHELPVIQRLMRHSSPLQTMRYIHNAEAQLTASASLQF